MLGALMLLGGGVQAAGQLFAGEANDAAAEQQAALLRQNAITVRKQGVQSEEALRRKQAQFLANQRTAMVQSGFSAVTGSNRDIAYQSESLAELDAMTMRYETEMRALGMTMQAGQVEAQGEADKFASRIGAAGSILSAAGSYGMMSGTRLGAIN